MAEYPFPVPVIAPDCVRRYNNRSKMATDFTTLREIEKKQLISVAQLIRFYDL